MKAFFLLLLAPLTLNARELSFDEALQIYVDRSTAVGISKETLSSIEAKNLPKHLTLLPDLSVTGLHSTGTSFGANQRTSSRSLGLTANLNLLKFGADFAQMRAANSTEEAQANNIADSILDAESEAASAISSYIDASMKVKIYQEIITLRERALKIAKQRFKLGLLPRQEADTALVDLNNAAASLSDAKSNLVTAKSALEVQLGKDETVKIEWPWKEALTKVALGDFSLQDLSKRPDWRAARKSEEAAGHLASQTFGQILPSLDLIGAYSYQHNLDSDLDGTYWNARLQLTVPLFDKLSNYGNYRSRVSLKKAATLSFENTKRQARREFLSAKGAFEIAVRTAKTREATARIIENLVEDNLKRFNSGRISVNDLQNDQNRFFNSKILEIAGWKQAHVAFVNLCNAAGKRSQVCLNGKETAKE